MGTPTLLDAAVLAPAFVLGLIGVGLGLGRSLVAWPMRWLIPLSGACLVTLPAMLYLAVHAEIGDLPSLFGTIATIAAGVIAFFVSIVLLVMFMGNLRERIRVWTGSRRIGPVERVFGGLFGIACGLLLVAIPYGLYESTRPDAGTDRSWARDSVSLPYFKSAAEAMRNALSSIVPLARRQSRRER
jgi:hypothetical protein